MMQSIIDNGIIYTQFMNSVFEAVQATFASEDRDEKLNDIYDKLSKRWQELYQESVGKYLAVPQLGISREGIQEVNNAITAYHQFLGETGDFLMMFGTPFKKSMDILQQAIKAKEGTEQEFKSAQEVSNFALKILDKEYDDWLKSPEGVQLLRPRHVEPLDAVVGPGGGS